MLLRGGGILTASQMCHVYIVKLESPSSITNYARIKGKFIDSNNIFLWHESEGINEKSVFPKFQLIPILHFQVMHNYVFHCSHSLD